MNAKCFFDFHQPDMDWTHHAHDPISTCLCKGCGRTLVAKGFGDVKVVPETPVYGKNILLIAVLVVAGLSVILFSFMT